MARSVHDEVVRRISYLESVSFDDAPPRFEGFLSWLECEPTTLRILTTLRQGTDIDKLTEGGGPYSAPKVQTPEDVARIGLFIFEYCREHPDNLPDLLFSLGCHDSSYNNFHVDFTNAVGKFINPFLRYLQEELREAPATVTLEEVVQFRRDSLLGPAFDSSFPETSRLLRNLSREMTSFTESENWFNIANSCRELLKRFSQELHQVSSLPAPEETKEGDFKGLVRYFLSKQMESGRQQDALVKLTSGAWDYVQSLLHDQNTCRSEAIRAYLWSGMVIAEMFALTHTAQQIASGNPRLHSGS